MSSTNEASYIDYQTFTSPTFSPTAFANNLILQTNNANDTPLDLSTPLSRVLFDVQEVDTHTDTLTTENALPIIEHTQARSEAGSKILESVEEQVRSLNESYARLEREVGERYAAAEQVRLAAERMLRTLRLGRGVQRAVQLGRQLEGQMDEVGREREGGGKTGNHRVMVPAANSLLGLRQLFVAEEEAGRVLVVGTLRQEVVSPAERQLLGRAQQVVREFSISSLLASGGAGPQGQGQGGGTPQTFAQTEDTKTRTTNALQTLYLLSPTKQAMTVERFEPTLLISALQSYLQTALTSSLAALTRALATLPTLDRTLLEISARCQNIVALEALLESIKPPVHTILASSQTTDPTTNAAVASTSNFLTPLLRHLDTSSLPSYFWRSMAGQLSSRVQDILNRGGVSARTLRTNRDRVRDAIRECVDRGSQLPVSGLSSSRKDAGKVGNWEREAAVMVQSVVGPLQR
ncbi:Conserved oligomeric Golgi complex subunit [Vermiconidia calcicola]|uniref:Conserved oligomeric Golgi complex subunit n=1 Tax=Vermiconidia calcicola TaxID=1690605 RepID=A0ACC3MZ32_9PEZI|nr:Conserved oligomeric Golgi complex subunit [Vermiconidia calcicola]